MSGPAAGSEFPPGPRTFRGGALEPGLEHFRRGRFELAALWFESAARRKPASAAAFWAAEARVALGLRQVHAGDHAAARAEFERGLSLAPRHVGAARQLARILYRSGQTEGALAWLASVAHLEPEGVRTSLLRAACLEARGERTAALAALDRALAAGLARPLAGRVPGSAAKPAAAGASEARRASLASRRPAWADLRCRLAVRLAERRPDQAAQHLEAALVSNPRYLRARLALALLRLGQDRPRDAVRELERARELETGYPDVRAWLGLARLRAHDARAAAGALEQAVAITREFARAHRFLALAYHALGRTGDALREARRGVVRDRELLGVPAGRWLPGLEAEGAEEDELLRSIAVRPASPDLQLALGRRRWEHGDLPEARRAFRDALGLQPGYAAAALELARAELALGRPGEAEGLLADLVTWRPGWVDAQALLGRTRLVLGDPRGAVLPLRAALRQRPELEAARADLAWALLALGGRARRDPGTEPRAEGARWAPAGA